MKWLVLWYDGNRNRVTLVEDNGANLPFGVDLGVIDADCELINAIVGVPDDFSETTWSDGDSENDIEQLSI